VYTLETGGGNPSNDFSKNSLFDERISYDDSYVVHQFVQTFAQRGGILHTMKHQMINIFEQPLDFHQCVLKLDKRFEQFQGKVAQHVFWPDNITTTLPSKVHLSYAAVNPNSSEVRGEVILEMVSNPVTSMSQRKMPTNTTPKSTIKAMASKKKPTRNPAFGKRKSLVASGGKAITAKTSKEPPTQNPVFGRV
jgi:hypothetical protein